MKTINYQSNIKCINTNYHKRWEKQINLKFVRYYEAKIQKDLFGQLILEIHWGRKDTRIGSKKIITGDSTEELEQKIIIIHKKRLQRHYCLVHNLA
jgi:hypothetical protein